MKKLPYVFFFSLFTLLACSSDDDNAQSSDATLAGIAWFGTDDDEGEVYTFTTDSDFTFSGDGSTQNGTYTFNGSSGVLNHSDGDFDFSVSGDILTVENGNSSIYIRQ